MIRSPDKSTVLLIVSSIFVLLLTGYYFWGSARLSSSVSMEEEEVVTFEPAQLEVNLEMAEISAFSGERREWELRSRSITKRDSLLYLEDVEGELFRDNLPSFRLQAEEGMVNIDLGWIELEMIQLDSPEEGTITGGSLVWQNEEELFLVNNLSMDTGTARITAGSGAISPQGGNILLDEGVEVRLKVSGVSP